MEYAWVVQVFLVPAMLMIGGKYLDYKIDHAKEEQKELQAQQKAEQDKIIHEQLDDLARKQQREADRDERISVIYDGLTAILRDRILQSSNHFIALGHITPLALENITKMHDAYKKLGGNGLCDKSFEDVNALPVDRFTQG